LIQDTAPDGNALSDALVEAKRSMIHARHYCDHLVINAQFLAVRKRTGGAVIVRFRT